MRIRLRIGPLAFMAQVGLVIALALRGGVAQESNHGQSIDLRSKGYFDLPKDFKYLQFQMANGQVSFLASDRVAVSFLANNKDIGLTDRERQSGGRWLFKTLVINVATGQLEKDWTWRTATPDSQFVSLQNGQFLVSSDERVTVHQADGQTLSRLDLPMTNVFPARTYGTVVVSDSGSVLFVVSDKDKDTQQVDTYRLPDLTVVTKFTIPYQSLVSRLSASEEGLIYLSKTAPYSLTLDHFGRDSNAVWACQTPWQCGLHSRFIGANRLILNDGMNTLVLVNDRGQLLQKHEFEKSEEIYGASVCSDGARIMVKLLRMGGGSTFLDVFPKAKAARIAILDADTLQEVASLPFDPSNPVRAGIDPKGDLVGYLVNGMLKLWRIPAPTDAK